MLTLNYDSWFMRTFLCYGKYSTPPKTICELGRVVLGMSLLWLVVMVIVCMLVAMYVIAVYGLLLSAFTDITIKEFFDIGAKESTWTSMALTMFCLINVIAVVVGSIVGFKWLKEFLRKKHEDAAKKHYEKAGVYSLQVTPSPITEFIKGIWARIHDKTCTMIQWENDPETLRQREREAERARWEADAKTRILESQKNA